MYGHSLEVSSIFHNIESGEKSAQALAILGIVMVVAIVMSKREKDELRAEIEEKIRRELIEKEVREKLEKEMAEKESK